MFYREAGQFKTSYKADQAVFPIFQDRIFVAIWLFLGFVVVPMLANEYVFRAIF
ncbi:MAG TPA: branched-chain amino acid ABC transporter permease, partial [Betaproteobacteria bacterium]|nr:branched-chain amino acid ABC transporter permease [Betaproteobacteria bacterium]